MFFIFMFIFRTLDIYFYCYVYIYYTVLFMVFFTIVVLHILPMIHKISVI